MFFNDSQWHKIDITRNAEKVKRRIKRHKKLKKIIWHWTDYASNWQNCNFIEGLLQIYWILMQYESECVWLAKVNSPRLAELSKVIPLESTRLHKNGTRFMTNGMRLFFEESNKTACEYNIFNICTLNDQNNTMISKRKRKKYFSWMKLWSEQLHIFGEVH